MVTTNQYGQLSNGDAVRAFTLSNRLLEVTLLEFGVRLASIRRAGVPHNLVLGYPDLAGYESDAASIGAVVGRFANRIRDGRFRLNGNNVQLSRNRNGYHIHGGYRGFGSRLWRGTAIDGGVRFDIDSADGEDGYPGNLHAAVHITLAEDSLQYRYEATSDADTIINLTNHAYFNLTGTTSILDHDLMLEAEHYLPVDENMLPTGEILPVEGTPFDFRRVKSIGQDIHADHVQLKRGSGFDHCYVLRGGGDEAPRVAAVLSADRIAMTVSTTEPGIQLYTGNHLPAKRGGVCLETQHFPDSPNQYGFPSTTLRAGETFTSTTQFRFELTP
ncbi:MAG TPA: aldose epimerase family protein [Pseudomonadales bacterium]|nr:aldose epimerase family protein [Pseudomonadales bacterium]